MHIIFDNTKGATHTSLVALQNRLEEKKKHELKIIELKSEEGRDDIVDVKLRAYMIIDKTADEIFIIGDGFRADRGGVGGSGYVDAQKLFRKYKLKPIIYSRYINLSEKWGDMHRDFYLNIANKYK